MDTNEIVPAPKREFQVYPDLSGSFRFRVVDTQNGQTVMVSGESFDSHYNAYRAAMREASLQLDGGVVVDVPDNVKPVRRKGFLARLFGG